MKTISGIELSKIGIGTYGVGGKGHRDMLLTEILVDEVYIEALAYMLSRGMNFTEISLGYGHGNAMRLFAETLKINNINRDSIFLTNSLYTNDFSDLETAKNDLKAFYKIIGTDYADSTLLTQSLIIRYGENRVYKLLHELLNSQRTRYISLSNASPLWIRKYKKEFGEKFFAHEGHLSFEVRSLQDKGVFTTCDELGVANIIWRPFHRSQTFSRNWPLLMRLAKKYNKTQAQIILNWIVRLGYSPMVFSTSKKHIDENLSSLDFEMSDEDFHGVVNFRPEGYRLPAIDWEGIKSSGDIAVQTKEFDNYKIK